MLYRGFCCLVVRVCFICSVVVYVCIALTTRGTGAGSPTLVLFKVSYDTNACGYSTPTVKGITLPGIVPLPAFVVPLTSGGRSCPVILSVGWVSLPGAISSKMLGSVAFLWVSFPSARLLPMGYSIVGWSTAPGMLFVVASSLNLLG